MKITFEVMDDAESKFSVVGETYSICLFRFFTVLELRFNPMPVQSLAEITKALAEALDEIDMEDERIAVGKRREFSDPECNFDVTVDMDCMEDQAI